MTQGRFGWPILFFLPQLGNGPLDVAGPPAAAACDFFYQHFCANDVDRFAQGALGLRRCSDGGTFIGCEAGGGQPPK